MGRPQAQLAVSLLALSLTVVNLSNPSKGSNSVRLVRRQSLTKEGPWREFVGWRKVPVCTDVR